MTVTLVLLTANDDAPALLQMLAAHGRDLELRHVVDLPGLRALMPTLGPKARLLSYLSNVIVPADCLAAFGLGAYNIHPGSPAYPGVAPEAWAAYEQAAAFGVTLHVMEPVVDSGTIIDAEVLPVPGPKARPTMAQAARQALPMLLLRQAGPLSREEPLVPVKKLAWGDTRRTVSDYERMCRFSADISREEMERRLVSFGPPGPVQFTLEFHGRTFILETPGGIMGHLDPPQPDRVLGWVCDTAAKGGPLEVKLTVDGQEFLLRAGEHRPDVAAAGFGDGYSGFVWAAPVHLRDGRPHRVEATCKGQPLPGSPRLVTFARPQASQG
ncbi:MAG TPA: formyltransferase family protein [Solidesulfovibrio magneticus]|nr:formyltransferase family protein [Solidesulfovibrio magneticus]